VITAGSGETITVLGVDAGALAARRSAARQRSNSAPPRTRTIDNTGDTTADMRIILIGTNLELAATDFML